LTFPNLFLFILDIFINIQKDTKMKRRFKISEDQLKKMVEMMNEEGSNAAPAKEARIGMTTSTLGNDTLFPTGKDEPNTKSSAFINLSDTIANNLKSILNTPSITKKQEIKVQGGASAVGAPGYNNKALADRRAANMISYLVQAINYKLQNDFSNPGERYTITQAPSVVGKATVKDSPEAKKEQFVKVTYPILSTGAVPPTTAIDTTATARRPLGPGDKIVGVGPKGNATQVKMLKTTDNKTVPINFDDYKQINSILTKYGFYLGGEHIRSGKSL
jgi:hypothetical protein